MAKKHFDFSDQKIEGEKKEPARKNRNTSKPKLKKHWKILIALVVLGIIAVVALALWYASFSVKDSKPVYGDRCNGVQEIGQNAIDSGIAAIKGKYSSVKEINVEVTCKELRIDIDFKKKTSAAKAKKIAEATVLAIDDATGKEKVKGSSYSDLFGKHNDIMQYEVQLYMTCTGDDFPIYGTKHATSDTFSYTMASIKDKSTYKKVTDTKAE